MSDLLSNGISSMYTNSSTNSSANSLESTLSKGDLANASDDELLSVCKDFESYFVEQIFKGMEKMVPKSEDEDSSSSTLKDYYKDELCSKYASSATESNGGKGIGIAQMLYNQMKRYYSSDATSTSTDLNTTTAAGTTAAGTTTTGTSASSDIEKNQAAAEAAIAKTTIQSV